MAKMVKYEKLRDRREVPAPQAIFAYTNSSYPHEHSSEPRTMKDLCTASYQFSCKAILAFALLYATPGYAIDRNSDVDRRSTYIIENDEQILEQGLVNWMQVF